MRYRRFGKIPWPVSALGFGTMRLPVVNQDPGQIDEEQATEMIYYALDQGVNYIDSAYSYHRGASEKLLGNILQGEYINKAKIATKMPCWLVEKESDFDRLFAEQQERLQRSKIDFYLLHSMHEATWLKMKELGVLRWAEKVKNRGYFDYFGFSFHDSLPVFKEIIDSFDWDFCQIQYNYLDQNYQAGRDGLVYASGKGMGVVVMEPIRGGALANPPPQIKAILNAYSSSRSPACWALLWVWNQEEVSLALSGMSTLEQVKENIATANLSGPGTLSQEELEVIEQARAALQNMRPIPCTSCKYCQPCPQGVSIPEIFEIYNNGMAFNDKEQAKRYYQQGLKEEEKASNCSECGQCEELCPQGIPIREWLKKVQEELGS